MRGLRLAGGIAAMLAGVALLVVPVAPARAASLAAAGWWYRATTTTPTAEVPQPLPGGHPELPATAPGPPTVGEGQLHVEGTPAGATAIAALTYRLTAESSPVLTITPDPTSVLPPGAVVLACRAAVEWLPPEASPGPWEAKPLVDCSRSVQGQPGAGGTLVFPLQMLVSGSLLDVVLVPGTMPELPPEARGSAFSLTFDRPQPTALVTAPSAPSDPGDDEQEEFPLSGDFDEGSFGGDDFALDSPGFGGVGSPVADPAASPALEPQDQAPSIPRVAPPVVGQVLDDVGAVRTLGLVLLLAGAVAAYLAANQPPRTTVGLGRFRRPLPAGAVAEPGFADPAGAEPVERGLGRLRRLRVGPPPAV